MSLKSVLFTIYYSFKWLIWMSIKYTIWQKKKKKMAGMNILANALLNIYILYPLFHLKNAAFNVILVPYRETVA